MWWLTNLASTRSYFGEPQADRFDVIVWLIGNGFCSRYGVSLGYEMRQTYHINCLSYLYIYIWVCFCFFRLFVSSWVVLSFCLQIFFFCVGFSVWKLHWSRDPSPCRFFSEKRPGWKSLLRWPTWSSRWPETFAKVALAKKRMKKLMFNLMISCITGDTSFLKLMWFKYTNLVIPFWPKSCFESTPSSLIEHTQFLPWWKWQWPWLAAAMWSFLFCSPPT